MAQLALEVAGTVSNLGMIGEEVAVWSVVMAEKGYPRLRLVGYRC